VHGGRLALREGDRVHPWPEPPRDAAVDARPAGLIDVGPFAVPRHGPLNADCVRYVDLSSNVKRPKLFVGVWDDRNAYFPHLDGASVMVFEARDLRGVDFGRTAEHAFAWTLFLSRHSEVQGHFARVAS
jgi:hypothetical protein